MVEDRDSAVGLLQHLSFPGASSKRVSGLLLRPKAEGVYPCVLLLHGLGSNKETMIKYFGNALAMRGFAVLALDAPGHGERAVTGDRPTDPVRFGVAIREDCRDYRRALDYLVTRNDIDNHRIGLLGYSMGAMAGCILTAVDTRITASVLCVGGDTVLPLAQSAPTQAGRSLLSVAPSLFIGHIAPRPVLMLNGSEDSTVTQSATMRLYNAAHAPREIKWYPSGHILPREAGMKAIEWLREHLMPSTNGASQPTP
jgi:predicted esterase